MIIFLKKIEKKQNNQEKLLIKKIRELIQKIDNKEKNINLLNKKKFIFPTYLKNDEILEVFKYFLIGANCKEFKTQSVWAEWKRNVHIVKKKYKYLSPPSIIREFEKFKKWSSSTNYREYFLNVHKEPLSLLEKEVIAKGGHTLHLFITPTILSQYIHLNLVEQVQKDNSLISPYSKDITQFFQNHNFPLPFSFSEIKPPAPTTKTLLIKIYIIHNIHHSSINPIHIYITNIYNSKENMEYLLNLLTKKNLVNFNLPKNIRICDTLFTKTYLKKLLTNELITTTPL